MEEEASYENLVIIYFALAHKTETYQIVLRKNKLSTKRLTIKFYTSFLKLFSLYFKSLKVTLIKVETCSYLMSLYAYYKKVY